MGPRRIRIGRPGGLAGRAVHAVAVAASIFSPLQAQQPDETAPCPELDRITVTATRVRQPVFAVPFTAHVVNRSDFLERRAARTLADALTETPGIMVQKTSYGQASPYIRGFTGFRTLMLVDGIRLNNAVFRDGPNQYWSTVDLSNVDRIDIVKGPSSVLYGSDAIGGTVNALTVQPPFANSPAGLTTPSGATLHASGYYRYASAENSHVARASLSLGATPNLGLQVGATWKDFDDLRAGDGTGFLPNSGYRERNLDLKVRQRVFGDVEIIAAYQRTRQDDVPRTHATVFGKSFSGSTLGTDLRRSLDQERDLGYMQAAIRNPASFVSTARISLSLHRQAEEQDRIRPNRRQEITGFVDDQYGVLLHFETLLSAATLNYGLEYYYDDVRSHGRELRPDGVVRALPRGPVADAASYEQLGIYFQEQLPLSARFAATAGVRYTFISAAASNVDPDVTDAVRFGPLDKTNQAVTGSLRLVFAPSPRWNVFGGVSQGFRAPNLSDYTSFELARSGERETPAPDLRPEKYLSFEIGTKASLPQLRTELYAAFHHTRIRNQVTRFPTGRMIESEREVTKANTGDGFTQGAEIGATVTFDQGLSLVANLAWVEGEVDTYVGPTLSREPASRMQPLTVFVGPRWESPGRRVWVEAVGQFVRRQSRLSPGDVADTQRIPPGGTPGYSVYHVRGGWRIRRALTVTAGLENVLHEDYRVHGSGINEPGLNFVASLHLAY